MKISHNSMGFAIDEGPFIQANVHITKQKETITNAFRYRKEKLLKFLEENTEQNSIARELVLHDWSIIDEIRDNFVQIFNKPVRIYEKDFVKDVLSSYKENMETISDELEKLMPLKESGESKIKEEVKIITEILNENEQRLKNNA